jgi:CubicO group peptidase (beta-lactamase class C family)
MRTKTIVAVFAAATLYLAAARAAEIPEDVTDYIRQTIDNGTYVGIVIGLVDGDETVIEGFGVASRETGEAPGADTVFEIGSITKTFTAALLAEAVLAGDMALDDAVQSYLPDGVTLAEVGDRPITLGDVATHMSGLPRMPLDFAPADPADPYADFDTGKLWEVIDTLTPARAPGAAAEYSNLGFALLGTIVARESGLAYRELVDERVFMPLGMTSSDTVLTDDRRERAAQGYGADGRPGPYWTIDAFAGAGAINSTVTDMLAYLRANMAASDAAGGGQLSRALALTHVRHGDFVPGGELQIGLAWITLPMGGGLWHNGGTGSFRSFMGFTDDGSRGVVVLSNSGGQGVDSIGYHLLNPALPLSEIREAIPLAPEMIEEYVGIYRVTPEIAFTLTRENDVLYVQLTGQSPLPLSAEAPDRFFSTAVGAAVSFERDDDGQIVALVLQQGAARTRAERLGPDGEPLQTFEYLALSPEELDVYVGSYQMAPQLVVSITRADDLLMAQLTGQPPIPIYPDAPDHFVYRVVAAEIDFTRDESGRVASLTLHQNGAELPAPRIPEPR